jgi:hypothetical protein
MRGSRQGDLRVSRSRKTFFNQRERHCFVRDTEQYPSAPDTGCNTTKSDKPMYSGTYVKGIATMHKSNAVPVTKGVNTNPKKHEGGLE